MKLFIYYSLIDWHHPDYPLEVYKQPTNEHGRCTHNDDDRCGTQGLVRSIDRGSVAARYAVGLLRSRLVATF